MKLIILISLILLSIIGGYSFYKNQNQTKKLGGDISVAKAFWLGFAIFQYFVLSTFLFLSSGEHVFKYVLSLLMVCFVIRAIFQGLMMYVFQKWKPYMGMIFNLLIFVLVSKKMIEVAVFGPLLSMSNLEYVVFLYLLMVLFMLILDTYYAWKFSKLVGNGTTGPNAIWYASAENSLFKKINQTTTFFNVLLLAWFIVILTKLIQLI